mmetsp:Transcript_94638/g.273638  ORF Transcript_94638/g.273638 Transcript_94638/m.273638 type:complete len:417 (-) Transcript_94638:126-1376(-)|eukprot:CAMPEP_0176068476 /NCGR_PEP_ID=MMETSP0120_2-20121206/34182_1 /TAXON_ID=160619 /ORGANISM="Kryptoperidinium foliaceum, Strain CCMP 1326" /LENGTH=416 /DNA_ID=CAMNT_0017402097 /DNA_START=45 /DNA_END=1295 /DNA_ORIENTATION=-
MFVAAKTSAAVRAAPGGRARRAASMGPVATRRSWADVARGVPKVDSSAAPQPKAESGQPKTEVALAPTCEEQPTVVPQSTPEVEAPAKQSTPEPSPAAQPAKLEIQAMLWPNPPAESPPPPPKPESAVPPQPQPASKPGAPGARSCPCRGEVLIVLGHYGWLAPAEPLDHPELGRHGGRIYFRRCDVADGAALAPGDCVDFYLYVDDRGLGAEDVRLQAEEAPRPGRRPRSCGPKLRFRGADVATERESAPRTVSLQAALSSGLSPVASEFVPKARVPQVTSAPAPAMWAAAKEFVPSAPVFTPAAAQQSHYGWFSAGAPPARSAKPQVAGAACAFNLAYFSDDSDDEDDSGSEAGYGKSRSAGWSAGSTGASSGCDDSDLEEPLSPPPGLPLPPGLCVMSKGPLPICPPPGLCLP